MGPTDGRFTPFEKTTSEPTHPQLRCEFVSTTGVVHGIELYVFCRGRRPASNQTSLGGERRRRRSLRERRRVSPFPRERVRRPISDDVDSCRRPARRLRGWGGTVRARVRVKQFFFTFLPGASESIRRSVVRPSVRPSLFPFRRRFRERESIESQSTDDDAPVSCKTDW